MEQYIPNWLKQRAELTPMRLAIKTKTREITYEQLYEKVQQRVNYFSTNNIKKGQHVAVLMKNSIEMIETLHALFAIGAISVLLNTRLSNQELAWQISDVEATHVICHKELEPKLIEVEKKVTVIICEDTKLDEKSLAIHGYSFDQVATIMYTSGTTGNPKGVMQTFGNHWSSAIGSALNLGLQMNDRWLLAVPLFHISGLSILIRSVIYGTSIVLHERFDARSMNEAIIKEEVTIVSVVTTMLQQMLEDLGSKQYPVSFRCMLAGGGPVPKPLLVECLHRQIPVYQTYGMTETASQIATLAPEYCLEKLGSAGKPLFSCDIKVEKDGRECSSNEEGEILVKGPNVTKGYWKRHDATADSLSNGWFHTGDIGFKDEDGFLFVLDRRSDLIISGGENVYPAEIEAVLLSHPLVVDAGVIGVKDSKWGEVPHAFIVTKKQVSKEELKDFCFKSLASYKVPKEITSMNELPRNSSNKLLRRLLKETIKDMTNDQN
ncbi:O-succinylbenzoic acid--CoA ligase [Metabacillus crassostreae]|uniref:o-succinylbenzoate--CoA ligase n=1 Tax=Metabacillus crassostreae TaxID=929098 RepID=UPI00195DC3D8|nr:o-succinylbenzoate--CoA ligase [Metabacillus crassostreae]MBM7606055.1 O-succinylbenzoic acid--CoA ligase [Metabacillus crassostreae]